jgi:starvation-inducible outer membrane lipoprotein
MKKALITLSALIFVTACAAPPGQIKKQTAPGQIQKETGYNPASGKIKDKHNK